METEFHCPLAYLFPQPVWKLDVEVRLRNPHWETTFGPITGHHISTPTGMGGTVSCQWAGAFLPNPAKVFLGLTIARQSGKARAILVTTRVTFAATCCRLPDRRTKELLPRKQR